MISLIKIIVLFLLLLNLFKSDPAIIQFHWKGNLTESSVSFRILPQYSQEQEFFMYIFEEKIQQDGNFQLQEQDIQSYTLLPQRKSVNNEQKMLHLQLENLKAKTAYNYIFSKQVIEFQNFQEKINEFMKKEGQTQGGGHYFFEFRTFGKQFDFQKFKFSIGSCAKTASESEIFIKIAEQEVDFFIQMGDIHYMDIDKNENQLFHEGYQRVFNSTRQRYFYSKVPLVYVWDDHDFGPNNSDASNPAKEAALSSYRQYAPHYEIPENSVYQKFIVGTALFMVYDPRSFLTTKTMLGEQQIQWTLSVLRDEELMSKITHLFIICGVHWYEDDWLEFEEERKEISTELDRLFKLGKIVMTIGGDAHMSGFDNGHNNPVGSFYALVAGPMDKANSCKGGEYIYGPYMKLNQFGKVEITSENCMTVSNFGLEGQYYSFNTCDENDRNIKRSQGCPLAPRTVAIIIFVPVIVVLIIIGLILYRCYLKKYRALLKEDQEEREQLNQKMENQKRLQTENSQINLSNNDMDSNNNNNNNNIINDGNLNQQNNNNNLNNNKNNNNNNIIEGNESNQNTNVNTNTNNKNLHDEFEQEDDFQSHSNQSLQKKKNALQIQELDLQKQVTAISENTKNITNESKQQLQQEEENENQNDNDNDKKLNKINSNQNLNRGVTSRTMNSQMSNINEFESIQKFDSQQNNNNNNNNVGNLGNIQEENSDRSSKHKQKQQKEYPSPNKSRHNLDKVLMNDDLQFMELQEDGIQDVKILEKSNISRQNSYFQSLMQYDQEDFNAKKIESQAGTQRYNKYIQKVQKFEHNTLKDNRDRVDSDLVCENVSERNEDKKVKNDRVVKDFNHVLTNSVMEGNLQAKPSKSQFVASKTHTYFSNQMDFSEIGKNNKSQSKLEFSKN